MTITNFLEQAEPADSALATIDGTSIRYDDLAALVERIAGQLLSAGVQAEERVAIVLPNGPAAAVATLAATSCATAAPLDA